MSWASRCRCSRGSRFVEAFDTNALQFDADFVGRLCETSDLVKFDLSYNCMRSTQDRVGCAVLEQRAATRLKRDGSLQIAVAGRTTAKGLSKPEGSAAYKLIVDEDVHFIRPGSERARTQIVYVLAAIDSEVRPGIGGAAVTGFIDRPD